MTTESRRGVVDVGMQQQAGIDAQRCRSHKDGHSGPGVGGRRSAHGGRVGALLGAGKKPQANEVAARHLDADGLGPDLAAAVPRAVLHAGAQRVLQAERLALKEGGDAVAPLKVGVGVVSTAAPTAGLANPLGFWLEERNTGSVTEVVVSVLVVEAVVVLSVVVKVMVVPVVVLVAEEVEAVVLVVPEEVVAVVLVVRVELEVAVVVVVLELGHSELGRSRKQVKSLRATLTPMASVHTSQRR
eukprot:CAMPEP_0171131880 /NCGR_PEP_ID=MMETSP0766_2-20121228/123505_1 /TAXON_ID=439317 /ORGANISM="Gambierdiscus australes, Strain CAWD 149" /LENGTH=242 /DNA_ID=CAMNT_0011595195 /DNA_START=260 /DNA_END=990 /DNA_ORIENTATION=+